MSKTNPKFRVGLVVDRSGSMAGPTLTDHIGGIKSFIADQQKQPGNTYLTFVQFDGHDPFEVIYDDVDVKSINTEDIFITPRSNTPLLDAVGKTIARLEEQEKQNPSDQVVLMVVTDGEENASTEWNKTDLKHVIDQKKDDWQFMFLGAGLDSFSDAHSLGVANHAVVNNANVQQMYAMNSTKLSTARSAVSNNRSKAEVYSSLCYTDEDKQILQNTWNANSTGE